MLVAAAEETKARFLAAFQILAGEEPFLERMKMAGCVLESVWAEDLSPSGWYDLKQSLLRLHRAPLDHESAKTIQNQWFKIFSRLT
jgi:hypothetical protein